MCFQHRRWPRCEGGRSTGPDSPRWPGFEIQTDIALVRNDWTDGWFLPGGAVEPGETPAGAARREVREETGLEATLEGPLVALEQTYVSETDGDAQFSALQVVYSATADGEIPGASQLGVSEEEIQSARWFETIPGNLHDGDLLRPYL